jgi:hypothetical protein
LRQFRLRQPELPQRPQDDIGHRRQAQPHLVGPHRRTTYPIREQHQLLLLDAILHVASAAVLLLVDRLPGERRGRQRGHHEARVGPLGQVLRLADHASLARPTVQRAIGKVLEDAGRLPGAGELLPGLRQFRSQLLQQAAVPGQAEQVIDAVVLAPGHQVLAGKAAVAANHDGHLLPDGTDAGNDAGQVLQGAGAGVDGGGPQQGQQGMIATKDVQMKITIGIVIAVKETAPLVAVPLEVGRVQVQEDARRRHHLLLQEGRDEEVLHALEVGDDLLVAAGGPGADGGQFQAIEGALAGPGLAAVGRTSPVLAGGVGFADEGGEQGIVAEGVVVVEVLATQAEGEDALLEELGEGVLDQLGVAEVGEAAGELVEEVKLGLDLAEGQAPRHRR